MASPLLQIIGNGPQGVVAMAILIVGFGAVYCRRSARRVRETEDTDGVAAAQQAIARVQKEWSVTNASKMLDALRQARLAPHSEAGLQPELERLERALDRSAASWDIPRFATATEPSEFGSALSAFIAKLRGTPLKWLDDPGRARSRHARGA